MYWHNPRLPPLVPGRVQVRDVIYLNEANFWLAKDESAEKREMGNLRHMAALGDTHAVKISCQVLKYPGSSLWPEWECAQSLGVISAALSAGSPWMADAGAS